jgi:GntR family transcriptional regulator
MRNVKVDRDDSLDLHEQVAGEIRSAIADGEAKPGERLPPAVPPRPRHHRDRHTPQSAVTARAKELVAFARLQGYRLDELVKIIESVG